MASEEKLHITDKRFSAEDRRRFRALLRGKARFIARHPDEWGVAAPHLETLERMLRDEDRPTTIYRLLPSGELTALQERGANQ